MQKENRVVVSSIQIQLSQTREFPLQGSHLHLFFSPLYRAVFFTCKEIAFCTTQYFCDMAPQQQI